MKTKKVLFYGTYCDNPRIDADTDYYNSIDMYLWFRIDDTMYKMVLDGFDGYRFYASYEEIEINETINKKLSYHEHPVELDLEDMKSSDDSFDGFRMYHRGDLVVELGTDHGDDYYPYYRNNVDYTRIGKIATLDYIKKL